MVSSGNKKWEYASYRHQWYSDVDTWYWLLQCKWSEEFTSIGSWEVEKTVVGLCVFFPTWKLCEGGWLTLCPQAWAALLGASWPADPARVCSPGFELDLMLGRLFWLAWVGEASEEGRETDGAAAQTLTKSEQTQVLISALWIKNNICYWEMYWFGDLLWAEAVKSSDKV